MSSRSLTTTQRNLVTRLGRSAAGIARALSGATYVPIVPTFALEPDETPFRAPEEPSPMPHRQPRDRKGRYATWR